MTFILFKLVSQRSPSASIWAGYLGKSLQAVSSLNPLLLLCRTSSPLFLSFHFLTASHPLLIKTTICYLLYMVHLNFRTAQRVVISILILYYLRKLIFGGG